MTCFHVGAQRDHILARIDAAQLGDPFRRLPIGDARIGQAGERQDRRIILRAHIVVGRIAEHHAERFWIGDRVSPLLPFGWCQRQAVVEHRVDHIDERHFRNDAAEQIGPQIGDRTHQQPTGRAAMRDDFAGRRVALRAQEFRGRDEVRERIRLPQELAVLVPVPALLGAAADMRDRIDEATVDQRQPASRKRSRHRVAIGAVAIQQQRRRAVRLHVAAMQDRDRNGFAVGRF